MSYPLLSVSALLVGLLSLVSCGSESSNGGSTSADRPLIDGCNPASAKILDSANTLAYPDMEVEGVEAAIKVLKQGFLQDSACLKISTTLVGLQAVRKDFMGMEKTLKSVLRLQPNNPSHLSTLGLVQEQLGRREKAQGLYVKAQGVYTEMLDSVARHEGAEGESYLKFSLGLCELLLGNENEAHVLIQEVYDQVGEGERKTKMAPFLNISRDEYVNLIWSNTPR